MTKTPVKSAQMLHAPFQHDCDVAEDFRGLKCPLPVLKARRTLSRVSSGVWAEFLTDDPASPLDMAHFCETEGHRLLQSETVGDVFSFLVEKGPDRS